MLKRFSQMLSNLTLARKMIVVFVFLVILPISVVSFISYQNYSKVIKNNTNLYASQLTNNIINRLDDYIGDMEQISLEPMYLTSIQQVLEDPYTNVTQKSVELDNYIRILNNIKRGTNSIYIFDNNNNKYYNIKSGGARPDLDARAAEWSALARKTAGRSILLSTQQVGTTSSRGYAFTVVRAINDYFTQETIGTIAVDANISVIHNLVQDLETAGHGKVLIVDEQSSVIYDTENKHIGLKVGEEPIIKQAIGASGDFIDRMDGIDYMCIYALSTKTGWKTIIRIPLEEITKDAVRTQNITLSATVLIMIMALIISILVSIALTNPLKKLMGLMSKVETGRLDVSFNVQRNDEAGRLGRHFNRMLERIKELIQQIYFIEGRKKEAELAALQHQINPHFLYNTLETIRMTAQINDDDEAAEMIAALGKLLRYSISPQRSTVLLQKEFEHLRLYVQVMNFRHGGQIDLRFDEYSDIQGYPVIPLLFQPLLENAIMHGLTQETSCITIRVSHEISEKGLIFFRISDDGKGIEPQRLDELNRLLQQGAPESTDEKQGGIGMLNVNERIKLHYGDAFGLQLQSSLQDGTLITLKLPYAEEKRREGS